MKLQIEKPKEFEWDYFNGIPVRIDARKYVVQKKTSRFRLVNLIYSMVFGYETIFYIKDDEVIKINDCIVMNPTTYQKLKKKISKQPEEI